MSAITRIRVSCTTSRSARKGASCVAGKPLRSESSRISASGSATFSGRNTVASGRMARGRPGSRPGFQAWKAGASRASPDGGAAGSIAPPSRSAQAAEAFSISSKRSW